MHEPNSSNTAGINCKSAWSVSRKAVVLLCWQSTTNLHTCTHPKANRTQQSTTHIEKDHPNLAHQHGNDQGLVLFEHAEAAGDLL